MEPANQVIRASVLRHNQSKTDKELFPAGLICEYILDAT